MRRVEGVAYVDGDAPFLRGCDGGRIQHLGAVAGHFEGRFITDCRYAAGRGHDLGVGSHDAGHVGPYLQVGGVQGGGKERGAVVGAAAAEGGHGALAVLRYEAGGHEHLHVRSRFHGLTYGGVGLYFVHRTAHGSASGSRGHEFAGIQPEGLYALAGKLPCDDIGGEHLPEGLDYGRDAPHVREHAAAFGDRIAPLLAGEQAVDYRNMSTFEAFDQMLGILGFSYLQQSVGAAADRGADENHFIFGRGLFDNVQHPGHCSGAGHRRASEFQYNHISFTTEQI